jgi:hypothetical protein
LDLVGGGWIWLEEVGLRQNPSVFRGFDLVENVSGGGERLILRTTFDGRFVIAWHLARKFGGRNDNRRTSFLMTRTQTIIQSKAQHGGLLPPPGKIEAFGCAANERGLSRPFGAEPFE